MRLLFILLSLLPVVFTVDKLTCTNDFTLVGNKCLKLFSSPLNRKDASKSCAKYVGTLATIRNADDNHAVTTIVGNATKRVWIGLYCFENDMSKCAWDDGSGSAGLYNNFTKGFPNIDVGRCVYYLVTGSLTGQWISGDCEEDSRPYVCETPTTFEDNCTLNYNGNCYFQSEYRLGFHAAQKQCEEMCANLVSIHSPNEIRFILKHYQRLYVDFLLIGGFKRENSTIWMDHSSWDYNNIDILGPQFGDCMTMAIRKLKMNEIESKVEGAWYYSYCHKARYFLCKRPAGIQCPDPQSSILTAITEEETSGCNMFLMAPGSFASPNYPRNYTNNLTCSYSLTTLGAQRIRLTFLDVNTAENHGIIRIYDGDSSNSKEIKTFSGEHTKTLSCDSTSNTMYITFTTDENGSGPGFKATFMPLV